MPKVAADEEFSELMPHARGLVQAGETVTVSVGDQRVVLDAHMSKMVVALLETAASGAPVEITLRLPELTTGQAADLLGVSRPTVVKLIEDGELPATRVGTRRRLATKDVIAYQQKKRDERSQALMEITALSQDLDLY